jgi:hypothetical protein
MLAVLEVTVFCDVMCDVMEGYQGWGRNLPEDTREAVISFETLAAAYQAARHHIPQ